jgi:hypothetical protein
MELIKGRKTKGQEARNEEKLRFPAAEETWEVSCGPRKSDKSQLPTSNRREWGFVLGGWELEVGN